MKPNPMEAFFCGFLGSLLAEFFIIYKTEKDGFVIPPAYKKLSFLAMRFLLAILSGFVAVFQGDGIYLPPFAAVQIGLTLPLFLESAMRNNRKGI